MTTHTPETLHRMTGPELNKLVALELGWTDVRVICGELWGWTPGPSNVISMKVPNWAGEIGAAWEPFTAGGLTKTIHYSQSKLWYVTIWRDGNEYNATCLHAPRAICIAFLLARAGQGVRSGE